MEARDALSGGGLADAIRAAAGLLDLDIEAPTVPAAPVIAGMPEGIAELVAQLQGAVAKAAQHVGETVHLAPQEIVRLEQRLAADLAPSRETPPAAPPSARRLREAVDMEGLLSAALGLAATLDAVMPHLRDVAGPRPTTTVTGCDLYEQAPALCIGGEGPNVHEGAFSLVIDLGGDDVYEGTSGAAVPTVNGLAASVVLDMSGNDLYRAHRPTGAGVPPVGVAGIGLLVDAAGNDSYEGSDDRADRDMAGLGSATAGVGVLADLAGNDSYTLTSTGSGVEDLRNLNGLGYGVAGAGILLDGGGDDTYRLDAETTADASSGSVHPGSPLVNGVGFASAGGVGLFSDAGGTDSITLRAAVAPTDPAGPDSLSQSKAAVSGVGHAVVGGAGVTILGRGSTSMLALAESGATSNGFAFPRSIGVGFSGGYGGVLDQGGDDTYRLDARGIARSTRVLNDSCDCFGGLVWAKPAFAESIGIGFGFTGVGVVVDESGNDRYISGALSRGEATITDERTGLPQREPEEGEEASVHAVAEGGRASSRAQGSGFVGGTGLLEDLSGDDVYDSLAREELAPVARSDLDDVEVEAFYFPWMSVGRVQGSADAGFGFLRDLGGTDRYTSIAELAYLGDPGEDLQEPWLFMFSQAGASLGVASLLDRDGGAADVFLTSPEVPACVGTRGRGEWVDCGGFGIGVNE